MRAIGLNKVFNNIEVLNRVMHQHNELSIENLQFTLANEIIPQKSFYGGVMSVINRGGGAWSGGFDITLPQNLDGPGGGVAFMLGVTLSLADEMEHNYQGWVERRGKAIIKSTVTIFMRFVESIPLQMKFVMTKKLLGENAWEAISGVRSSGIDEKPTALWKRVTKFTGVILSDSAKKKDALFMRSSCVRFRNLTSKISKEDLQRIMDVASERFNFNVKRGAENIFVDIASTDIAILNITRLTDKIKRNIPARSIINILKKRSIDTDERYLGSFIKHCNNKVNLTCDEAFELVDYIAEYWNRIHPDDKVCGVGLARILRRLGMNIFEGSSKAHKNQVRSSYTGDEIDGFVLGREEGVHLSSDGYRDFLLDDNEDKLIRLYANNPLEAEFRMGPELPDWTQAFLPEIFHLNGHVIVMERITTSIVDIPWTSEEMNLLEIDNRHMIAMASLARACAENGMMPKKMLTKGSLTFSEECIKFRDIKLKPFNLIEMETLLWSFSQNNRYVFANLMAASHIKDVDSQAMIVPLYREALDLAVDNLEFDPEQIIAIRFGENNPKLSTELNVFYSRVRVLKSRIIKTIKESYLCDTDEAKALLADFIGDSMKIFYQESCAITVLMEDIFCRDIVNGFLSLNELEMKPKDVIRILQRIIKELTNTGIETLDSLDVLLTDSLFQKHGVVNSEQIRHVFRFRIYKCFEYIFKGELL